MSAASDPKRELLRHMLATLAYRGGKALRDAPAEFATMQAGPNGRTPVQILAHLGDLLEWALWLAKGQHVWKEAAPLPWEQETTRFFAALAALDAYLASAAPLNAPVEKLFQGPIADAFTHVGQLAMMRRLGGSPMRGENYFRADIVVGRVGADQPAPVREFV
jgi:hypothetical protein